MVIFSFQDNKELFCYIYYVDGCETIYSCSLIYLYLGPKEVVLEQIHVSAIR